MYFPALFTEKFRSNDNLPPMSTASVKVVSANFQEQGLFGGMVDSGLEPEIDSVAWDILLGQKSRTLSKGNEITSKRHVGASKKGCPLLKDGII